MISRQRLWQLRNELSVDRVLQELGVATKMHGGYLRFVCPLCRDFNTATNPTTNLGRCFRCQKNFNTIDLVVTVTRRDFLDAVAWLEELID